ncbi:jg9757 [Pararge aegeria aegeria]|uniref:Jg9757 protein n=1 Tax=Pararge aegeria aegeria TaxID=348720 RepID=A0A8S4RKI9_9NEOP|nr:jg9757 [Pararge aegeria aegeria]
MSEASRRAVERAACGKSHVICIYYYTHLRLSDTEYFKYKIKRRQSCGQQLVLYIDRLRVTQRLMERAMLGVHIRGQIRDIRGRAKFTDIAHRSRRACERCVPKVLQYPPNTGKRSSPPTSTGSPLTIGYFTALRIRATSQIFTLERACPADDSLWVLKVEKTEAGRMFQIFAGLIRNQETRHR